MRTPAFQQFADECQRVKRVAEAITAYYQAQEFPSEEGLMLVVANDSAEAPFSELGGESLTSKELSKFSVEAERHARLLQTLWEWAQSQDWPPNEAHIASSEPMDDVARMIQRGGVVEAKAHVRALLTAHAEDGR